MNKFYSSKKDNTARFQGVGIDTNSNTFIPSVIDPLYWLTEKDSNGKDILFFVNDIYLLFNQKRLESLGTDSIKYWLDSLQPSVDGLAELRKNVTDEQLISTIKSRRLQEPSEIKLWLDYLGGLYKTNKAELDGALSNPEDTTITTDTTNV